MKKVLVVDDSRFVRNFHTNLLKAAGFKADGAMDGVEALEKALSNKYDLILSDINMPNMDGIVFVEKYRQSDNETPIIMISTQAEAANKEKAIQAGANLYIVKPVKPNTLVLHVKMLVG
ncbi:MAG: response regulator [Candidatus Desulfofervidaceae bacterium]|nr:response regulator [Candidatus Desulfofervidaceae bacterium]